MKGEYNIGSLFYSYLYTEDVSELGIDPDHYNVFTRIYDCLEGHASNGGLNTFNKSPYNYDQIDTMQMQVIQKLLEKNVNFDQLLTNYYYIPDDQDFRLMRRLQALNQQRGQGVTVSTLAMAEFVAQNFPNLLIRWSITAVYRDRPENLPSYVYKVLKVCDRIVIPPEYNFSPVLNELPANTIELMALDRCGTGCKFRKSHYHLTSREQLKLAEGLLDSAGEEADWHIAKDYCRYVHSMANNPPPRDWLLLGRERLYQLMAMGINKFKIASRNFINAPDLLYYFQVADDILSGKIEERISQELIPKKAIIQIAQESKNMKKEFPG